METASNKTTIKCKKRKTRKCLDEIRKRSRCNTQAESLKKSPLVGKITSNVAQTNGKHSITAGRLTLQFPKSIRSETATRQSVLESQMGSTHCDRHFVNNRVLSTATSNNSLSIIHSDSDFLDNTDEENLPALSKHNGLNHLSITQFNETENMSEDQDEDSPASFILFSPNDRAVDSDMFDQSLNEDSISTTPEVSREDGSYHLYDKFMKDIPTFLKELAPALIKDDVMKKTKSLLHNIYTEGCRRECEENILHCIKSNVLSNHRPFTMKESIVQNPMDYIRLGYTWRQSMSHKLPHGAPSASPPPQSPRSPTTPAPGPARPRSPTPAHCSAALRPDHDSPEYNYYPHKLNL